MPSERHTLVSPRFDNSKDENLLFWNLILEGKADNIHGKFSCKVLLFQKHTVMVTLELY